MLVGHPSDDDEHGEWAETLREALEAMDIAHRDMHWGGCQALPKLPGSDGDNRRGDYDCSNEGPSYGGGQTVRNLRS